PRARHHREDVQRVQHGLRPCVRRNRVPRRDPGGGPVGSATLFRHVGRLHREQGMSLAVVGSAHLDLVATVPPRPPPGETVLGAGYAKHRGGKAFTQAVAAATLTQPGFDGCHGTDGGGFVTELTRRGADTKHFTPVAGPSGRAMITVTPDGENSITVLPEA